MRRAGSGEDHAGLIKDPRLAPDAPHVEHMPVLLREAVDLLAPRPGGVYLDGTCGGGGHAALLLERSAPDGRVIGLDRDDEALARCRLRLAAYGDRVTVLQSDFRDMAAVLTDLKVEAVDGVLLDLGVSSYHLRTPERGFSFLLEGPLDMRMDRRGRETAADLVNGLPGEELAAIIREYGEDHKAGAIARAIVKARSRGPITSTTQLAQIISGVFPPFPPRRIHPATRTFQALRIAVNDELSSLREGLLQALRVLRTGGRVAVISFHSLEDRVVKQQFAVWAKGCTCPPRVPLCVCGKQPVVEVVTRKPVTPGDRELDENPASRSAKLRAAEKLRADA